MGAKTRAGMVSKKAREKELAKEAAGGTAGLQTATVRSGATGEAGVGARSVRPPIRKNKGISSLCHGFASRDGRNGLPDDPPGSCALPSKELHLKLEYSLFCVPLTAVLYHCRSAEEALQNCIMPQFRYCGLNDYERS